MFKPDMPHDQADLLASLIEEEDFTASLGETLYQVARRVERQTFSPVGHELVDATLDQIADGDARRSRPTAQECAAGRRRQRRRACRSCSRCASAACKLGADLPWEERGAILTLLGSAERAFYLIDRIDAERRSVSRAVARRGGSAGAPDRRAAAGRRRRLPA